MCQTETFKSHTCSHQWMTIVKPCSPNASFKNRYHQYKPVRSGLQKLMQPDYVSAPANSCPNCDKKGEYDADKTRIILKSPAEAGNIGNGYDMTDGRGNVLQPRYLGGALPPGSRYTACGVSRVSVPPQQQPGQQSGCCILM